MTSGELRISNYNYDARTLLERVRTLFDRDDRLLGDVVMRSVLASVPASGKQHVMTRIEILPKAVPLDPPELLDYGTILFFRDSFSREELLSRLRPSHIAS